MEKSAGQLTSEVVFKAVQMAPGGTTKTICSKIDYFLFDETGKTRERMVSSQIVVRILKELRNDGKIEIEARNNYKSLRFWPVRRNLQ